MLMHKVLLIGLMSGMLMLTGCSSGQHADRVNLKVTAQQTQITHPPRPRPVKLRDEKWQSCDDGKYVCMTYAEAKLVTANKIEVGRYISELNNVVAYYRTLGPKQAPKKKRVMKLGSNGGKDPLFRTSNTKPSSLKKKNSK